jgi:UDP-N-acetylmuramoylalanine--D-glutamate ligase
LEADLVFLSPGVPLDAPLVQAARERGVPLSTETRLFLSLCPAPVIGITGSSGKTTTTTLVGEMAQAQGRRTFVGGNIGQPLIGALDQIASDDAVVMELSSFQLDLCGPWPPETKDAAAFPTLRQGKSPHVAAILNITPNHLDRHGTMEAYIEAKANILRYQTADDVAVLGVDDPVARGLRDRVRGRLIGFSMERPLAQGAFLQDGAIHIRVDDQAGVVCQVDEIGLLGRHNVANVLAACALAATIGVSIDTMAQVATAFTGVEHRLERVREIDGVRYYNDSIATSPERAIAALRSFQAPVILLAGGRDKHLPWDDWAQVAAEQAKQVLLFGEAAELIEQAARQAWNGQEDVPALTHCGTMANALACAQAVSEPGDVVLLAPGGTSYDAYTDYAERGRLFKALVMALSPSEEE